MPKIFERMCIPFLANARIPAIKIEVQNQINSMLNMSHRRGSYPNRLQDWMVWRTWTYLHPPTSPQNKFVYFIETPWAVSHESNKHRQRWPALPPAAHLLTLATLATPRVTLTTTQPSRTCLCWAPDEKSAPPPPGIDGKHLGFEVGGWGGGSGQPPLGRFQK